MQSIKSVVQTLAILAIASCLSLTARAQIGSGWTAYTPSMELQESGDVSHSGSIGGTETFSINGSTTSSTQRCEQRAEDDFSSGTGQFQGMVKVTSLGGTGISLQQDKAANGGTWMMIAVDNDGTLYCVNPGTTIATGVVGVTVQINTITDADAKTTTAYVNGSKKATLNDISPPIYHKYGTYRLDSGKGPITAEWSGIQYWKGGSASGGGGGTTVAFEAENVAVTNSGVGTSVQTDANSSNGEWVSLNAVNTGSWMQFTTPTIQAGTYSISMEWKSHTDRGIASFKVDGNSIGSNLDQYSATTTYPTTTIGTVTFSSSGTHTVRLTVEGQNSASSGYILSADKFTFTAQ
jgi:hypothetical protein